MSGPNVATLAWRNLWRNRRRTLLTLGSIVFGVFLAVVFTAMQDRNWKDMIDLAARLGGGHVSLQHPGVPRQADTDPHGRSRRGARGRARRGIAENPARRRPRDRSDDAGDSGRDLQRRLHRLRSGGRGRDDALDPRGDRRGLGPRAGRPERRDPGAPPGQQPGDGAGRQDGLHADRQARRDRERPGEVAGDAPDQRADGRRRLLPAADRHGARPARLRRGRSDPGRRVPGGSAEERRRSPAGSAASWARRRPPCPGTRVSRNWRRSSRSRSAGRWSWRS